MTHDPSKHIYDAGRWLLPSPSTQKDYLVRQGQLVHAGMFKLCKTATALAVGYAAFSLGLNYGLYRLTGSGMSWFTNLASSVVFIAILVMVVHAYRTAWKLGAARLIEEFYRYSHFRHCEGFDHELPTRVGAEADAAGDWQR